MSAEYQAKQAALVADHIRKQDAIVVTTASDPRPPSCPSWSAPEHVASMKPGSVLVDLAVEQGGNVVGARLDEIADVGGVKIVGIGNLAGRIAADASALYARQPHRLRGAASVKDGQLEPDPRRRDPEGGAGGCTTARWCTRR